MSRIPGKDTKPEITLRKYLWNNGYRYRLKSSLPGKPDFYFPTKRLAVFVDGCYWHGCPEHFSTPKTNTDYWLNKIRKNTERDRVVSAKLVENGWTVVRFWEHEVRRDADDCARRVFVACGIV